MSVIDKLTPAQEAKKEEYKVRFQKMAVSTEPTNRVEAEKAVNDFYDYMKLPRPKIHWELSPMKGIVVAGKAASKQAGDLVASNPGWTIDQVLSITVPKEEVQAQAYKAFFGSFDAHYFAFYSFIARELPVKSDNLIDISERICEHLGVHWLFEGFAVLTEKPCKVITKDNMLHNTEGPALEYRDGETGYFINGEFKQSLMEIMLENKLQA
jgi:hypothetical protein